MEPSRECRRAVAALNGAQARSASHEEILRLSAEVIRTRNAMTVDRLQAGWLAPADILKHLTADGQLLGERDDMAVDSKPLPSTAATAALPRRRGQVEDAGPSAKAGMDLMSDIENSQTVRDAERAAADLAKAVHVGAALREVAELTSARASADARVESLLHRDEPSGYQRRQSADDRFERRQRRRKAVRAEMDEQDRST
jgi:hypothetical protein